MCIRRKINRGRLSMKIIKGEPGYIRSKKKQEIVKACIEFGLVLAVFITGYITTKTRLNLLTLVAVLGCLPAAKALVGVIMLIPQHSMEKEKVKEMEEKSAQLVKAYDMVLTSYEKVMPVDSIVILGNIICGYSGNSKTDPGYTASYIKRTLANNRYDKVSVKIFTDYKAYLSRVEGMENMAEVEKAESREYEEGMKQVILSLSM